MASALDEMIDRLKRLEPDKLSELADGVAKATGKWFPASKPQRLAANSLADVTLYGGQGGGGKTDLGVGLAFTQHHRSLIMRRQYTDLTAITERAIDINGSRRGFNGAIPPTLRTDDGRLIEFGAAKNAGDGREPGDEGHWMGRPHDLLYIDEATQFAESQVRFLMGWVRSAKEGQRCRTILGTNPPLSSVGYWVIPMFAPWLDPEFPQPAGPGELRWVVTIPDEATGRHKDVWVEGPDAKIPSGDYDLEGNPKYLIPKSRTFIPASVEDNPYYRGTNYQAELDALPEPARSAVRDGNFMAAREDEARQVIPSIWVKQAQERWRKDPPYGIPMCAIGVDGARIKDQNVLAPRHDGWYASLITVPGAEVSHGRDLAALVIKHRQDNATPVIDVLEEVGAQAEAHLSMNGTECFSYRGYEETFERTADSQLGFYNRRSAAYWLFREGLDPDQEGGSTMALPPDPELEADLTAPTFDLVSRNGQTVVKILSKEKVCEKLGRSTDKGDAVVMSWYRGPRAKTHIQIWQPDERVGPVNHQRRPRVNLGPRRQLR